MKKITLTNATPTTGVEFTLTDQEIDSFGSSRVAVKKGAAFDGKTVAFEMQDPTTGVTDWYNTGITFTNEAGALVAKLRPNYLYRLVPSVIGGALNVTFMFF